MIPSTTRRLSKSRFLSGLQCSKRLFFEVYAPELAEKADDQRQAMLDMGKEIGLAAQRRFPGGMVVEEDYRHSQAALERTAELLGDPKVPAIFEGAFQFEGTFVRVDILERVQEETWRLIEVKASARVKSVHIDDLALQTYVLQGCGILLTGSFLMHINRHYAYLGGPLDLEQLFSIQEITDAIATRLAPLPDQVHALREVLGLSEAPDVEPGTHCHVPYSCPFWSHCTQKKPDRWIFHLPGSKEVFRRLTKRGVNTIDDIPPEFSLTVLQRRVKENVEWISPHLAQTLQSVRYPVHHLDFETFMPAIPLYPGTRPYQPLPVQWSNHIEWEDLTLRHDSYLCRDAKDPREEVAVGLLESLGSEGSICVYSEYERYVLNSLAEAVPALSRELHQVVGRLWDLLSVIQDYYFHPDFKGSFSIKSVLPALVPLLGYEDLEIQAGASASAIYHRMVCYETDWVERDRLASALQQYCARDTLGMVELRRVLWAKAMGASAT